MPSYLKAAALAACSTLGAPHAWSQTIADVVSDAAESAPIRRTWQNPRPVPPPAGDGWARASSLFLSANADPEADMPRELAYTRDGQSVVVIHQDTDNVTFFDVATRTVTDTIAVGDFPQHVAVTPDNQYAVVPNTLGHTVSLIDVASRSVVATVPITGQQPYRVAVTPDSRYAVVGIINDAVTSAISVIDLTTRTEVQNFPTTPQGVIGGFFTPESGIFGNIFTQFALTADGSGIVLPDRGGAKVQVYDRATGAVTASIPTSAGPTAVDVSADGTVAVVSHEATPPTISKIDLTTGTLAGAWGTTDSLFGQVVRITPDKSHAIAAISNNVIFVNLTTGARAATLNTGTVGDIELSYDGQYAFVSNFNARVIDVAARSIVATMTLAACAESAASPVEHRAVALNNRFREDVQVYTISGAGGLAEGLASSGEPPEGDATRDLAISADGTLAVACNNTSRNVCVLDLTSDTIRSYVDVGERPLDAAITPDQHYAVVCAADADRVQILDLTTDTVVASLTISSRPARVRISPDGQTAYVLNVAGTDRISFIHIDGAASSLLGQVAAGQTGSAQGYTYTEISGIELSPDGSVLAVCDSFNDFLRLFDTASRTQLAAVPVGDFPIRVAFSPDGTRAYATNSFSDNISVVNVDGASSSLIGNFGALDFPLTVNVDAAGQFVYFGNSGASPAVRVFDTSSNTFVRTVTLAGGDSVRDAYLSYTDGVLYCATVNGTLTRISAAGAASAVLDSQPLSSGPSDLVFDNGLARAVVAQPVPDGVDLVQFGCVEDLNGDRAIDLDDLSQLLVHFGESVSTREEGDVNGDGRVDLGDLSALLVVFGGTCG